MAAALDHNGGLLGIESFTADQAGYESLVGWLGGFGEVIRIGVEGTGSWGVGLARFLHSQDIVVVEVDRPNRQKRRKVGQSDPTDALAAARSALSGEASVFPKQLNCPVEQVRLLLVVRLSHASEQSEHRRFNEKLQNEKISNGSYSHRILSYDRKNTDGKKDSRNL